MKLLKNSIEIKTEKLEKSIDKIRAIVLIELKVLAKYENFMTIVLSQIWGTDSKSQICKEYVFEYITIIEKIVKEGMDKEEIIKGDSSLIASGIFGLVCSSLLYKMREEKELEIEKTYRKIDREYIRKLIK